MSIKKFSSCAIVLLLVSTGFGLIASDSAQAAFIQPLSNVGLPGTFIAYDTAWNEAGSMAVVVGYDSSGTGTNAYAYFPNNDTYWPIDNDGYNGQRLHAVDYFSQPIYDWPNVLLVDADYSSDGLINFYSNLFSNCRAYVDVWTVWEYGAPSYWVKGKPNAQDMAPYDLVVWVPSRYMEGWYGSGDALNPNDVAEIKNYLNDGGNFFISNLEFANCYWSTFSTGGFAYDYLGASGYGSTSYEYYARPAPSDSVFGSLGANWQNWNSYGWSGYPYATNILYPGPGTACFQGGTSDAMSWQNTGLRYDSGVFKTIYFGFPLETVPVASEIMRLTLEWLESPDPDQVNEYMGTPSYLDIGISTGNPWAQSFVPTRSSISRIEFYVYRDSSTSDWFAVDIFADGGSVPTGSPLFSSAISSASIPVGSANAGWVGCDITASGLTVGIPYWIVCTRFGFSCPQIWMADMSESYAAGVAMEYSGGTWTGPMGYDWLFRTYPSGTASSTPQSISISPAKDTTIYSEYTSNGNGAGEFLIAGTDYYPHQRRAPMEFNIIANIPRYSTITGVSLQMYCTGYEYGSNSYSVSLCPVWNEWGEAGSDAPGIEETGTSASTGDATWEYRYYPSDAWPMYGGDLAGSIASTSVSAMDTWYTWSSVDMVNYVQTCLDVPSSNHGWMVVGDESSAYTAKWFASKDSPNPGFSPRLMVTYTEPTVIGYEDVFWMVGDLTGAPPATCYKVVPSEMLALNPVNAGYGHPSFYAMAVDDLGNPLCACYNNVDAFYFDGDVWMTIPDQAGTLMSQIFDGMDFNVNDRRFYAVGQGGIWYTDPVPFIAGESKLHRFNHFTGTGEDIQAIAWNDNHNYGLVAEGSRMLKVWPYGEYANGSIRYSVISEDAQCSFNDISWDTDGWNEAAIVGTYSTSKMYWRYYNSNPQLIEGYNGLAGFYYTCAFKPPSSPKWVFIPSSSGSIRVNVEEKDQSGELVVSSEFPHIFGLGMWKQSDPARLSTLNTQVSPGSVYTFAFEGNYTRNNLDNWNNLDIYITGWFDFGSTGAPSAPGDPTWLLGNFRNSQFNISYDPGTDTASMLYPALLPPAGPEFSIASFWQDPTAYGSDGMSHRLYVNVSFGPQITMASGPGTPAGGGANWLKNLALNDANTWDLRVYIRDSATTSAYNMTWDEFGVQRYASITTSGSPSGSIPPGAVLGLSTPTTIHYSTNVQYKLNVSIPNLYKNGIPGPTYISAGYVQVWNDHSNAAGWSNISMYTQFNGPNLNQLIWGLESTWIQPVGSGVESSGPMYSDYTAAASAIPFEVTEVWWAVEVPVGTPEGVYRATITITLWS